MIRRNPMLVMLFVMAAAILLQGIGVTYADTGATGERQLHPYAIRDPNVDPNMSHRQRARMQRDAAAQKRHTAKKFVKDFAEGKVGTDAKNKGGAK